jgi:hypothetical protein
MKLRLAIGLALTVLVAFALGCAGYDAPRAGVGTPGSPAMRGVPSWRAPSGAREEYTRIPPGVR